MNDAPICTAGDRFTNDAGRAVPPASGGCEHIHHAGETRVPRNVESWLCWALVHGLVLVEGLIQILDRLP